MPIGDKAAATVSAFAAASKGLIDWVLSESGFQVTPMPGCSAWSSEWAIQCAHIVHGASAVIFSATVKSPRKTHALALVVRPEGRVQGGAEVALLPGR